jgi:hypothetical protein
VKSKRIRAGVYEVTTDVGKFHVWKSPTGGRDGRKWFVNEEPDEKGETLRANGFPTKTEATDWLAKYVEDMPLTCGECLQEFHRDEMTDGVCDECNREECPECEGTGADPESDTYEDCDYCGGDGVV